MGKGVMVVTYRQPGLTLPRRQWPALRLDLDHHKTGAEIELAGSLFQTWTSCAPTFRSAQPVL